MAGTFRFWEPEVDILGPTRFQKNAPDFFAKAQCAENLINVMVFSLKNMQFLIFVENANGVTFYSRKGNTIYDFHKNNENSSSFD